MASHLPRSFLQRHKAELGVGAAALAAYAYYRGRLRDERDVALAQGGGRARAAAVPAPAPLPPPPRLEEAWWELEAAVRDARRHAAFLEGELAGVAGGLRAGAPDAPARLESLLEDSRAHADYVAQEVDAFARLMGFAPVAGRLGGGDAVSPMTGPTVHSGGGGGGGALK
jgi:hypothetical protein